MKKVAIFISGRGSNMKAILEQWKTGVLKDKMDVQLVFSNKPEAAGLQIAQEYGVHTESIKSKGLKRKTFDKKVLDLLSKFDLDYIILAGYMRILSADFVRAYPNKIINIHPADTTQHQGLNGYQWAFETKLKETKITVHYVDEGLDTGTIIGQAVVDLSATTTLEEVEKAGLAVEHDFYSKAIAQLL